jgi:hypothetical protein
MVFWLLGFHLLFVVGKDALNIEVPQMRAEILNLSLTMIKKSFIS